MSRFKSKKTYIIAMIITGVVLGITVATTAFAIWQITPDASAIFEMAVGDENPSLKYQLYVPINAQGERVKGTYDFAMHDYTLNSPAEEVNVASVALVGWNGGIAVNRLIVPDKFSFKINGVLKEYNVTKVLVDPEYRNYYFANNDIINYIIIPANVISIDRGAFLSMINLKTLTFKGAIDINIGDYAFANCPNLPFHTCPDGRKIIGDETLIFAKG